MTYACLRIWTLLVLAVALPCHGWSATYVVDQHHRRASDVNAGTVNLPLKTISAAAKVAKPGDAILVKDGIYRECVNLPAGIPEARMTLRAWKGHRPIIAGSEVVTAPWREAHVALRTSPKQLTEETNAGKTPEFLQAYIDYLNQRGTADTSKQEEAAAWRGEDPAVPFVGIYVCDDAPYTQMVFVDGQPLKQIGPCQFVGPKDWPGLLPVDGRSPADMRPGTFSYDAAAKRLYVWLADSRSPAKRTVEAALRQHALIFSGYTTVSGIATRHCQMDNSGGGTGISGHGNGIIVERCTTIYNDFSGIVVEGEDGIIRQCEMSYNGNDGYTANDCRRIRFEGNEVHHNNTRRYESWHCGGVKVTEFRDSIFIGNDFHDELDVALWLDINCNNCTIVENRFEDCGALYFEICRWGVIANNVFRNVTRGIWSYSSDVLIAHNVLDRCGEGITVTGDLRAAEYRNGPSEPLEICLAAVRNNMVVNNIIIDSPGSYIGISPDSPHCGNNLSDYNVFVWTAPMWHWGANHIKFMGSWDQYYGRLSIWQGERSYDKHSLIADATYRTAYQTRDLRKNSPVDPRMLIDDPGFVHPKKGDYRLRDDSPLRGRGIMIPERLAAAYASGQRAWERTLIAAAPDPATATTLYTAWGGEHYREQPLPAPVMLFDPTTQSVGTPGLNEEWIRSKRYPSFLVK